MKSHKLHVTGLLKSTSRTFYLSLRVLPKRLREPVSLAYLLARALDTIADTRTLPPLKRKECLLEFRRKVIGHMDPTATERIASSLSDRQPLELNQRLLESLGPAFEMLGEMHKSDATKIRTVIDTLTRGMEFDLTTFPTEDSGTVEALMTKEALDEYTYLVAGCVGEFWTDISVKHTRTLGHWNVNKMAALGVRFGKGLQMVNVLKDVPSDLRIGRCYLPELSLKDAGLEPSSLLMPETSIQARSVLVDCISIALGHFCAAKEYLVAIPRRCVRLRLATAWPMLIGLETLAVLARNPHWLEPERPSKVTRRWVYLMVGISILGIGSNRFMSAWIGRLKSKVDRAL